ncbi:hypothetical protein [Amycolatopsis sp. Hca4]|uniref:hypothetical protein n=1 Tax=Amycolatopsis sp. Hca4 TaxID=2742131 RepID=UPI001591F6FD|nr:hypothetical protein [Amycolatopsis sp. Hca4]QKV75199.1 hypothetical protein HUT10_16570 [Amycolatopsis sp. Hca4]
MRLVRLERQQSRVADDIRAALASLGRGSTVIGGVALVGVGGVTDRPIEAVVLLPHGVIIVIGVDLPDPALRLEAPLGGPWKADGWPLVADDESVNPATEALDVSQACERRIAELVPGTAPVGTIIAVGPYVETVDQPATDLAGPVRVLHPTPTTMLAATVSLATAHRPRSVDQARALIRGLAPGAPELSDEVLLGEGFSRLTDDAPPESLWDGPAAAPAAVPAPAGVTAAGGTDWRTETPLPVLPAAAEEASAFSVAEGDSSPVQGEADRPAGQAETEQPARPAFPGTETTPPAAELPSPTQEEPNRPAESSAGPVFPGTEAEVPATEVLSPTEPDRPAEAPVLPGDETTSPAAEPEATEVLAADSSTRPVFPGTETTPPAAELPSPAQAEPNRPAESSAEPVFPGTETTPPAAELPSPAQAEPNRPAESSAGPVFPGTEAAESPQSPESPPSSGPETAESSAAETERTENLRLPAPSSEQIGAPGGPAETGQTPAESAEPEAGNSGPAAPANSTRTGAAEPQPTGPGPAEAAPTKTGPAQPAEIGPTSTPADQPEPPQTAIPPLPSPQPFPRPRPAPDPTAPASRTVRWLPLAAIGGLVLLVVAAIAVATTGDGTAAAPAPPKTSVVQPPPAATPVRSLRFDLRAAGGDQRCASHAFGDAQASLQQTSCSGVKRASYAATVDGRVAAVTVGIVEFPDAAQAAAFKGVADTPGGGGVLDLAAETGQWGATPAPRFENAAYASKLDGSSVRLVQAVWAPGPSTPDDPGLVRAAKAALDLPAQ